MNTIFNQFCCQGVRLFVEFVIGDLAEFVDHGNSLWMACSERTNHIDKCLALIIVERFALRHTDDTCLILFVGQRDGLDLVVSAQSLLYKGLESFHQNLHIGL